MFLKVESGVESQVQSILKFLGKMLNISCDLVWKLDLFFQE